jgi:hypothetical protein
LYSPKIIRSVSAERASPSLMELNQLREEEKATLLELLRSESKPINESQYYVQFVKKGWLKLDEGTVSFPCHFSKEILYLHFYGLNRPIKDEFDSLEQFMFAFLQRLPRNFLATSLSKSIDKSNTLLEIFWCHEFYRISYGLLRQDTYTHGQVQKVENFQIDGKVDFIIKNGDRTWVIEFLICGDDKINRVETEASSHISRFQGKYKVFKQYQYLIIDFRPGKGAKLQTVDYPNYWLVYYDPTNNYRLDLIRQSENMQSLTPF